MTESKVDASLFANYVPLNALRPESQADLARKSVVSTARAGDSLFKLGDSADRALFLMSGALQLKDGDGKVVSTIRAGEPSAMHRIAHQSPRRVTAQCATDVRYLAIDAGLLDVMLTWDQTGSFEVGELVAGETETGGDEDWMTRLLQMRTFQLVPPSNLQAMFMRMQEVQVEPGQVIVRQNDAGDYFYVVMSGRFIVTREQPNQKPVRLAELETGACFGEEALISETRRNATVTALVRGKLMRLSKDDFRTLLNDPLSRRIGADEATAMVEGGKARWLDVRLPSEFQRGSLPGTLNLPLYMLRMKLGQLDAQQTWIACCDTGRRSSVAAFILTQKGFDAYVLDGGIPASNRGDGA
ncbi:cyclic nucleotide-binding domain-containing protein [Sinimarinibacterium flocculans]|uniref:cyclic nucleotide-binding domain-containing protein n=1 Tax=Sinimarinibacterium flocculans TaxID=985250 RepID=UPI002E99224E|nr:cyclic nucleotide-binding domain-containing protein [Pseudomonadota bacterium]